MGVRETQWWYTDREGRHGPVPEQKLVELIRARSLPPDVTVWTEGLSQWKRVAEVDALFPGLSRVRAAAPAHAAGPGAAERPSRATTQAESPYAPPRAPVAEIERPVAELEGDLDVPWRRFLARQLDWFIFLVATVVVAAVVLAFLADPGTADRMLSAGGGWPFILMCLPVAHVLMGLCVGILGNTPGKWLLALRIQKLAGEATLGDYIRRELRCWIYGAALGLPLVCIIPYLHNHTIVKRGERPSWDDATGFVVTGRRPLGALRVIGFVAACVVAVVLQGVLTK